MMPFPGGIESIANGALILSVVAAILTAYMAGTPPGMRRSVVKTASVALLALLAWIEGGPWLLVAALVLSAAGDAFLSREGDSAFLAGLASFLAAHVLYVALFLRADVEPFLPWLANGVVALVLALAALLMARLLWRSAPAPLRLPILLYTAAILAMGLSALTLDSPAVIVGAILFMVSDTLLGAERFLLAAGSPHRTWMRYGIWVTYYAAQLMITLGFLLGAS